MANSDLPLQFRVGVELVLEVVRLLEKLEASGSFNAMRALYQESPSAAHPYIYIYMYLRFGQAAYNPRSQILIGRGDAGRLTVISSLSAKARTSEPSRETMNLEL